MVEIKGEEPHVQEFESKVVNRVTNYPAVSNAIETAKEYYKWGKETSPIVASVQSTIEGGIQYILPTVQPIFENAMVTAKPILISADNLGSSALDKAEENAQKFKENFETTRVVVAQKVATVDEYLKDSLVALPLNIALEVTEKAVDKYLPNEDVKKGEIRGPISKTTYISKRIQHEAFAKLQNLSLRGPDKLNAMEYTVDLIKYAAGALDSGVNTFNQTVQKGVQTGSTLIKEAPKEVKEKIQMATQDALAAIHTAVEVISKQIPTDVTTKFNQLKDAAFNYKEGDQLSLFANVAQSSSKLLHEATDTISGYLARKETIPAQILSSTYTNLNKVLDNLISLVTPAQTESKKANETEK